jgi:hypothetical protein
VTLLGKLHVTYTNVGVPSAQSLVEYLTKILIIPMKLQRCRKVLTP